MCLSPDPGRVKMEIQTVKNNFNLDKVSTIIKTQKNSQFDMQTARMIFIPFWIGGVKIEIEKRLFVPAKLSFMLLAMEAVEGNVGLSEGFPRDILKLKANNRYVVLPKINEEMAREGLRKFTMDYMIRRYSLLPKISVGEISLIYKPYWYTKGSGKYGKKFLLIDAEVGGIDYNLRDFLFDELANCDF